MTERGMTSDEMDCFVAFGSGSVWAKLRGTAGDMQTALWSLLRHLTGGDNPTISVREFGNASQEDWEETMRDWVIECDTADATRRPNLGEKSAAR